MANNAQTGPKGPELQTVIDWARSNAFHFSTKHVETNAEHTCSIRLSSRQAMDMPYISARTLMAERIEVPLDYAGDAKSAANFRLFNVTYRPDDSKSRDYATLRDKIEKAENKAAKDGVPANVRSLISGGKVAFWEMGEAGSLNEFDQIVEDGCKQLRSAMTEAQLELHIVDSGAVDLRIKQLLLPRDEGDGFSYLSMSPIASSGLNMLIEKSIRRMATPPEDSSGDEWKHHQRAWSSFGRVMGSWVGGANPQNAGALLVGITPRACFSVPNESPRVRKAYAVLYGEYKPFIASADAQPVYEVLARRLANEGARDSYFKKDLSRAALQLVLSAYAQAAQISRDVMKQTSWRDENDELVQRVDGVSLETAGWLFPSQRSPQWKDAAAKALVDVFAKTRVLAIDGSGRILPPVGSADRADLFKALGGVL